MNLIIRILIFLFQCLLSWAIAALALYGMVTLTAEWLQVTEGLPRWPMILTVALALALWRQLVRRTPAVAAPETAPPAPPQPSNAKAAEQPLHDILTAPGAREPLTDEPRVAELIGEAFQLQLRLLRQCHQLNTVAVLWSEANSSNLTLQGIDSQRNDLIPGPFPKGIGIIGVLAKGQNELALAPVRAGLGTLPYYRDLSGVGSLLAIRIVADAASNGNAAPWGILCVDRESESPWSDAERLALRLAARKIGLEVQLGKRLRAMDDEWLAVRQVCVGLHELNQGLGLEAAFDATGKAVKALVPADFIAISLVQGNNHTTCWAQGSQAEQVRGATFPLRSGLVGQVLKYNRALPEAAVYSGASPVFCENNYFADYKSLRILPLRKEGEPPLGTLTIAAQQPQAFSRPQLELLELIAAQAAIKIDLAQAHEIINNLAITDSLTGLANHRAFIHGLEVMLQRAQRQQNPLAVLMCDVDHFKKVNDRYGHPFGDQVLKKVAEGIGNSVRVVDLAARYGGEEFALVLEDSNLEGALLMAERLRREVEGLSLQHNHEKVSVTISLGLAVYPADGENSKSLLDCADQALYHAKTGGRNRITTWAALQQNRARLRTGAN